MIAFPVHGTGKTPDASRIVDRQIDMDPLIRSLGDLLQAGVDQSLIVHRQVDAVHELSAVPAVDDQRLRPAERGESGPDFMSFLHSRLMFVLAAGNSARTHCVAVDQQPATDQNVSIGGGRFAADGTQAVYGPGQQCRIHRIDRRIGASITAQLSQGFRHDGNMFEIEISRLHMFVPISRRHRVQNAHLENIAGLKPQP
ncbi:hypothetical protein SDC9_88096 [bioreactor metagenome]|uniref:Uncharacterized protein n=1 Tax=bioreactor metagenome TaxID=1076179 RepID=A0A644ZNN8_9ZZZZ